jgi:hypothetical protein
MAIIIQPVPICRKVLCNRSLTSFELDYCFGTERFSRRGEVRNVAI